ncbi:Superfamily II DNA or RNA helicase [Lachnospiraceae bacterium XBB2008]|nr:Superfamily II DNA or RNA helicase [Lachnospiraceae bacterium XBB2008]
MDKVEDVSIIQTDANTMNKPRWISEAIGDSYKEWKKGYFYFLEAPTGTGKTSFVLKNLLEWIIKEQNPGSFPYHITYLVNRKILKQQIDEELRDIAVSIAPMSGHEWINQYITVLSYQTIEDGYFNGCPWWLNPQTTNYIIADEAHYFLNDAMFNTNTQLSFNWIYEQCEHSVILFMSATLEDFKKSFVDAVMNYHGINPYGVSLNGVKHSAELHTVPVEKRIIDLPSADRDIKKLKVRCFDDVEDIPALIKLGKASEKWLVFIDNSSVCEKLQKTLVDSNISAVFLDAEYKRYPDKYEAVSSIAKENMFKNTVLIATSVLDNGVTLIDKRIKNIILVADDRITFLQMLGRKRVEDNEELQLFLPIPKLKDYSGRLNAYKQDLERVFDIPDTMIYGKNLADLVKSDRFTYDRKFLFPFFARLVMRIEDAESISKEIINCIGPSELHDDCLVNQIAQIIQSRAPQFELCYLVNCFTRAKLINDIKFYDAEIEKFKATKDEYSFVKTKLEWLGFDSLQSEQIILESKASEIEGFHDGVQKSIKTDLLDKTFSTEEKKQYSDEYEKVYRGLLKFCMLEDRVSKTEYKQLDAKLFKNDRGMSPETFNRLMEIFELPYYMERESLSLFTCKHIDQ